MIFESVVFLNEYKSEKPTEFNINLWGRDLKLKVNYQIYKGENISEGQERAIGKLMATKNALESSKTKVVEYITKNYKDEIDDEKIENIFKYVVPKSLYVLHTDKTRSVVLLCDFKFDNEHGIGVLFENEKCIKVSSQDEFL